ncbi:hypothetical protein GCM10007092_08960 [Thermus composti]|uniref:Uncharacterized protein n=1 Tax=Thermus composti TaxID=532059 RepID=A0ABV6PXU4_9DEIN|nr:hypothetical protein [Thermus composti]GGM97486.1 hypothetical protein GCM10007092_08960 [Thermus composti]
MRKIPPIARRFPLEAPPDDRAEWREVPLEERLRAVWEMALFWAALEAERAKERGETPEIATDRLLPVARKRPLGG